MKVLVDGVFHDADEKFIGIIFENDAERNRISKQISEMEDHEGIRAFMIFPDKLVKKTVEEQIKLIKESR